MSPSEKFFDWLKSEIVAEPETGRNSWEHCLEVLFAGPKGEPSATIEVLRECGLMSPSRGANSSPGQLTEELANVPFGRQRAPVLHQLAKWWIEQFGDDTNPIWPASFEELRATLRKIRGLGPEHVDRILLRAGGYKVFPVSRATLRIAVRHRWLDTETQDDEWQTFFAGNLTSRDLNLAAVEKRLLDIGHKFCGKVAECEACPLECLLPPQGPYEPGTV